MNIDDQWKVLAGAALRDIALPPDKDKADKQGFAGKHAVLVLICKATKK